MLPCRTIIDEEEAGEVDAYVEVEARGRWAVGDAIPIFDRAKEKIGSNISCRTLSVRSEDTTPILSCFLSARHASIVRQRDFNEASGGRFRGAGRSGSGSWIQTGRSRAEGGRGRLVQRTRPNPIHL